MHRFHDMIRSCLPDAHRKEPVFKSPPTDAVRNQWFDVTPGTALPLKDPSYTQQKHQSLVASLSIRVPQRDHEHLARLWMACINEFVRPRVCHLRISGTIEELAELHRCVDLYHEHPWSITQGYGLLIENVESSSSHQDSGLTSLLQSGHAPTSSWDLRLRANWGIDASSNADSMPGGSRYVLRSGKQQSLDQLFVELPFDNPDGADFRSTQMHLAAHIDERLSKRNAWQYEGPRVDSPQGQLHLSLVKSLQLSVPNHESIDLTSLPAKGAPGILATIIAKFSVMVLLSSPPPVLRTQQAQHMPGLIRPTSACVRRLLR